MANSLGSIQSSVIVQEALKLVFAKRPILKNITTDFSTGKVALKGQPVISRIHTIPPVNDFGTGASDAVSTDVTVIVNQHKEVHRAFTLDELASTNRNLIAEAAEPMAVAIANHLAAAVAALYTIGNFPNASTVTAANFNYGALVTLEKELGKRGVEDGLFCITNADAYASVKTDAIIVSQLNNGGQDTIKSGLIGEVSGFSLTRYPALPTVGNLIAFAGRKDSVVIASRLPLDSAATANFPGSVGVVTDEGSGFSVLVTEWQDPATLKFNVRLSFMYGVAIGNPVTGQIVKSA